MVALLYYLCFTGHFDSCLYIVFLVISAFEKEIQKVINCFGKGD